jgi:DNA replication licensing factor MCM6
MVSQNPARLFVNASALTSVSGRSVLHLSDVERTTSQGVDREELVEWYLEQKEHELTSVADLDDEREIIGKALTRLVKDKYLMELRGAVGDSIGDETMDASSTDHAQVHYVVRKYRDFARFPSRIPKSDT